MRAYPIIADCRLPIADLFFFPFYNLPFAFCLYAILPPLMLTKFLRSLWIKSPRFFRRLTVRLIEPRFTVSVGAVVQDRQERILLLKHVFRPGSGWGIPGGFIAVGEQPEEALTREIKEETGLEIENPRLIFSRMHIKPKHLELVFLARSHGAAEVCSMEISDAEWFGLDELPQDLNKDQRWLIKRALNDGIEKQS
jgi:ADP-ribose pyrophosphatase YjhB (NUDIX family)